MFDRKKITTGIVFFIALSFLFLLVFQKTGKEKNGGHRKEGAFVVAERTTPTGETKQDGSSAKDESEDDDSDSSFQYEVSSDDEIKETAVKAINDLYGDYDDMDFSRASAGEMIFVKNTEPGSRSVGYYLVVLRNPENEIMARIALTIKKEDGNKKLLEAGNAEPFPPSWSDPETQAEYRKAEKFPLTDSFPRISEERAMEIAEKKLGSGYFSAGLTNLFLYLPSLEYHFQIGVPFSPYYEFVMPGDDEKTIWINSETGVVVGYPHLDSEARRFENTMALERLKSSPPEPEEEHNADVD